MKFIADFHIHSKYSRATSREMELENMDKWAFLKGIKVLGTGDFTHPEWFKEIKEKLEPTGTGLYKLKGESKGTLFLLTTEISCIYSKKGRVRKIHILVFAPNFEAVEKINARLSLVGNLKADGRPILGLDAREFVEIILNICNNCLIVPAHLMTPWFSLFGSRSGFDSLNECFEDYSKYIFAGETGLSADPSMLWRIKDAREMCLISNSDAHSLTKIGREANVFDTELSYDAILEAIKTRDKSKFLYTIEFFPEEGKYHYDGHRLCGVRLSPEESKKYNNLCPRCAKPLTLGVLNRVEQLSDKPVGFEPEDKIPFKKIVPLVEIIAEVEGTSSLTKTVQAEYFNLISKLGPEFKILLDIPFEELKENIRPELAQAILRVREGDLKIEPGYDGVFGKVRIFSKERNQDLVKQKTLF